LRTAGTVVAGRSAREGCTVDRLANKTAIITGAARGMGAATARLFAAEGARVVLADVLDAEGEALARELGAVAFFRHHDVADEDSWQGLLGETLARFGGVDILINNAGVLLMRGLMDISKQEFERVLGINLVGTFLGIKALAPKIIERGGGTPPPRTRPASGACAVSPRSRRWSLDRAACGSTRFIRAASVRR
jgi:NAD(P)-dependent dehydrogenase (short-subunit alcohol dehydrogenase family)